MGATVTEELLSKSLTGTRPRVITNAEGTITANIYALHAVTDITLTTLTGAFDGSANLVTSGLSAGQIVYLPIHTILIATGTAIIYRHTNA